MELVQITAVIGAAASLICTLVVGGTELFLSNAPCPPWKVMTRKMRRRSGVWEGN